MSTTSHCESPSSVTIAAVQPCLRTNDMAPLTSARRVINIMKDVAQKNSIDLFVLPELCPLGYCENTFNEYLPNSPTTEKIIKEVDDLICSFAKDSGCSVCYGTIGNDNGSSEHTIRQVVVDCAGSVVCTYDKTHLCDYGDCSETRYFVAGNTPCSFSIKGFKIGIIICADIRNPTLCRTLARPPHNCDVILQPAAFSRDVSFRTWNSFKEVRAVENSVYFIAVNYSGAYYGNSTAVELWVDDNHEPESLATEEGVLVKCIRRDLLNKIRVEFPYHRQLMNELSRPEEY